MLKLTVNVLLWYVITIQVVLGYDVVSLRHVIEDSSSKVHRTWKINFSYLSYRGYPISWSLISALSPTPSYHHHHHHHLNRKSCSSPPFSRRMAQFSEQISIHVFFTHYTVDGEVPNLDIHILDDHHSWPWEPLVVWLELQHGPTPNSASVHWLPQAPHWKRPGQHQRQQ